MLRRHPKSTPLNNEDSSGSPRKSSFGTVRSENAALSQLHTHTRPPEISEPIQQVRKPSLSTNMRNKQISPPAQPSSSSNANISSHWQGHIRFPKLEEYAHFHYDVVEIPSLKVSLCDDDNVGYKHNVDTAGPDGLEMFLVSVTGTAPKSWMIRRSLANFAMLDRQLHSCIFDRKFSHLADLDTAHLERKTSQEVRSILHTYLNHLSDLAGGMVNCGSVLSWMEMDNRGHRLVATDDSGINTPAIAAAHVVKRYTAQAADEISLQVGDMISVIDMPPGDDTMWWRGKRGFEVGFFPSECVEVIKDKVPSSMASRITEPLATAAASRKPLMRKHGKLLSFLRTFFSQRPPRNQLKQSGIVKERVFGCDLGEHLLNSGHDVPLLLKSCTEIIEKYGIVHGIYRLSGITSNIQKLRLAFDEDRVPDLTEECYLQDIHSISSLLKMYFRELPNPLLTYQLYDKFADAVRDEDNKLLKIHDVVQQLPPPHYRTTEFLMRHLACVAAFGQETEMHSKNLAIVWAPNLLRSKELEAGGGAAALQGVGIQAVVTECLICYCDIIFSDKMPNYGLQDGQKGQKKPRPKSLAISTPTRLLSLEEARERAIGPLASCQKFIDVGGGPKNLPSKYHTVLDVQGYKKKASNKEKENKPTQAKKSPSMSGRSSNAGGGGGWKSIFIKPRAGSVKKARKGSGQDNVSLSPVQAKALTEEDVHNWKRNLRTAKSAESLFSMSATPSSTSSLGSRSSRSNMDNGEFLTPVLGRDREAMKGKRILSHKRSLSSDASAVLHSRFVPQDSRGLPSPMDDEDFDGNPTKQSFVRGDSTRKALHHRGRIPSAPSTPLENRKSSRQGACSPLKGDSGGEDMDISLDDFVYPKSESRGDVNIDAAIKSRLQQVADKNRQSQDDVTSSSSPMKRCAKTPPKGRKKARGLESRHQRGQDDEKSQLVPQQSSPQKHEGQSVEKIPVDTDDHESRLRLIYSRLHDYAEIASDEDALNTPSSQGTMSMSSSGCNMQDVLDQIDSRLAMNATFFSKLGTVESGSNTSYHDYSVVKDSSSPFSTPCKETEIIVTDSNVSTCASNETESHPAMSISPHEASSHSFDNAVTPESMSQTSEGVTVKNENFTYAQGNVSPLSESKNEMSSSNTSPSEGFSTSHIYHRRVDPNSSSSCNNTKFTRVVRRRAEFIPSSNPSADLDDLLDCLEVHNNQRRQLSRRGLEKRLPSSKSTSLTSSPSHRPPQQHHHHSVPHHQVSQEYFDPTKPPKSPSVDSKISALGVKGQGQVESSQGHSGMSKCLSVPSDIARSLENVTGSQSDILSSVTISELSMSRNSFSNGIADMRPAPSRPPVDPRQRRSSSLDSLNENDRLLSRTLREINQQMEAAFKHTPSDPSNVEQSSSFGAVLQRHRQHSPRLVSSDLDLSNIRPESIDPLEVEANTATYSPNVAKNLESPPSSPHQYSDQTLTPTQNSMVDHSSHLSSPSRKHLPLNESSSQEQYSKSSSSIQQSTITHSDLDDDSPAFITDNPEMEVCRNLTFAESSAVHVHEFFPTSDSPASPPSHVQNPLYNFPSSMSSIENNLSPPQTERQVDDLTVVEPPPSAACFSRSKDVRRTLKDENNPISVVRSPSDLVSFDRREPSSTSSEDFDEVASASSDDDGKEHAGGAAFVHGKIESCREPSLQSHKPPGGAKRDFNLPLTYKTALKEDDDVMDNSWTDPWRVASDRQAGGCSMPSLGQSEVESPVVIRRHSPYAGQRSSWMDRSFSPSSLQSPTSGLISSGGSGLPNFDSDDESVFNWKNNSLFSSTGNEGEEESAERMLSLRAAGLASQRARLSRESSNSSLQSPDVSYSSIVPGPVRPPQAIQVLPDIVQSTTTSARSNNTDDMSHSNVPLQLALYHPDEFAMDIQAAIVGPGVNPPTIPSSSSLPQVHTTSDTVVMKKSTLKKSSTDNALFNQVGDMPLRDLRAGRGRDSEMPGNLNVAKSSSPQEDRHYKRVSGSTAPVPTPSPLMRTRTASDNIEDRSAPPRRKSRQSTGSGLNQSSHFYPAADSALGLPGEHAQDQVAMEVDNLCNKLVDDLNSPCSIEAPTEFPPEESITVLASHDIRTEHDEQGEISMELETTMEVKSSQPSSPLVRERRIIRSCNDDRLNTETRFVSVQHPDEGEVDGEAVQNVLNTGREILMQPDQTQLIETQDVSSEKAPQPLVTAACNMASPNAPYITVRKTSFSKIPRPRANTDSSPKSTSRLACPVVSTSSRNRCSESSASSSLHASSTGSSPSSSSSSSSSRTSYSHSRRASETGSMSAQMARRSNHSRRSSDTRLNDLKSDASPTTRHSSSTPSSASSPRSAAHGAKTKSSISNPKHAAVQDNSGRSRIPLSHRVPIPQGNEKESLSPSMSRSTRHQLQTQQPRKTTSPCAKPRKLNRSSLKSDPCFEAAAEVTQPTAGRSEYSEPSRKHSIKKDGDGLKHVVVKDLNEDGGAKLVIEIQPELKKKIQTVHAKKVPLPSRQVAESLETDPSRGSIDSGMVSAVVSDTSKETSDHLSNAPKEEKENKTPPPVPARKFGYDSLSLPRPNKQRMAQVNLTSQQGIKENYSEMIGSRSSLDDSVLQLAAERQQIFIPCSDRDHDSYGYSTGSLRVKRSQRLQSLVDLFEKSTESNVSDSPGGSPSTRHRTYSASSTSTHIENACTGGESDSLNVDSQGNSRMAVFHPPSSSDNQILQTSMECKSREQERYPQRRSMISSEADYDNLSSERKDGTHSGKDVETRPKRSSQRVPPEAAKRSTSSVSGSASGAASASCPPTAPKNFKPPRHQTSRPRTQSESSASESDSAHQSDSNALSHNSTFDSASVSSSPVVLRNRTSSQSDTPPTSPKDDRQSDRRGSIKELRMLFEKSSSEQDGTCMHHSTTPPQLRQRIRSVSPPTEVCGESRQERANLMRLSLEIPSGSAAGSHFDFKAHPMRLGPKPFYSMNK